MKSLAIPEKHEAMALVSRGVDPVFRTEIEMNPAYDENRATLLEIFDNTGSEMMMPLKYKDETRGVLSLGIKKSGKMFFPEDVDLLKTVVNQSTVALENAKLFEENLEKGRMEEELKIAHDLQSSMLPETAPDIAGFEVAARSISAREVGGDFYDFIDIHTDNDSRKLGVIVGDVSGKAVSGALVMAAARSIFRVLAADETSVGNIMKVANSRLNKDVKKGMFVALLYAVLDPLEKTLTFSNAGQTQPLMQPALQGEVEFVDSEGDRFPLGILPECDYQENTVNLSSGDTVFFYTDGVVEALSKEGEMYGFDRLQNVITTNRGKDVHAVMENLMMDIEEFSGETEQHDDITVVVVKVV
jgi:serine phosphatase RsbU (regulator of sigma subunit)